MATSDEFPYEAKALMRYKSPPGQTPFVLLKDSLVTITGGDEDWLNGILKDTGVEIVIPAQFIEKIEGSVQEEPVVVGVGSVAAEEIVEPVVEDTKEEQEELSASNDQEQQTKPIIEASTPSVLPPLLIPAVVTSSVVSPTLVTSPSSPTRSLIPVSSSSSPKVTSPLPLPPTISSPPPPPPSVATLAPTTMPVKITPSSPSSASAPDLPIKPLSLKERIAALNAAGAGALSPSSGPPPPRPKPAAFVRKSGIPTPTPTSPSSSIVPPTLSTPSSSTSDQVLPSSSKFTEMNPQDAADSIKKGGSLKERMAALQGLQLDSTTVPGLPGRAPKPWKRKEEPVVVVPEEAPVLVKVEEDDAEEPEATQEKKEDDPSIEKKVQVVEKEDNETITSSSATSPISLSNSVTVTTEDSKGGEEEESEEVKKAALVARMASLGGQRVGMAMPSIPKRTAGPPKRRVVAPALAVAAEPVEEIKKVEKEEELEEKKKEGEEGVVVEKKEATSPQLDAVEPDEIVDSITSVIPSIEGELTEEDLPSQPRAPSPPPPLNLNVEELKEVSSETSSPISPLSKAINEVLGPNPSSPLTREGEPESTKTETKVADIESVDEEMQEDEEEEEEEAEEVVADDSSFEVIDEPEGEEHYDHQSSISSPEEEPEIVSSPPPIVGRPPIPSGRPAIPTAFSAPPPPISVTERMIPTLPASLPPSRPMVAIPKIPEPVEESSHSVEAEAEGGETAEEEDEEEKIVEVSEEKAVSEEPENREEGEEEEEEEDPEVVRRAALAKRMAALGGMNMRMGPMMPPIGGLRKPAKSSSTSSDISTTEDTPPPIARRLPGMIPTGGMLMPGMMPRVAPSEPESVVEEKQGSGDFESQETESEELVEEEVKLEPTPPPLPSGRPPIPSSSSSSIPPPPPNRSVPVPSHSDSIPPPLPSGRPSVITVQHQDHFVEEPTEFEEDGEEDASSIPRDASIASLQSIPTSPIRSSLPPSLPSSPPPSRRPPPPGQSFNEQDTLPSLPSKQHSRNKSVAQSEKSFSQSIHSIEALPVPSLPQLLEFSTKLGSQVFACAHGQKSVKHSSDLTFVDSCIARASEILPRQGYSFGIPIFTVVVPTSSSNKSSPPSINEIDSPRSGDIVVFIEAKVKHNLTSIKLGTQEKPHVAIVESWDGKKRKVKVLEIGRDGGIEEGGYRIEELKGGRVTIFRVVPKSYVE